MTRRLPVQQPHVVDIEAYVDDANTYTTVIVQGRRPYKGIGTAKRNPADRFDWTVGFNVAYARALHAYADAIDREAQAALG